MLSSVIHRVGAYCSYSTIRCAMGHTLEVNNFSHLDNRFLSALTTSTLQSLVGGVISYIKKFYQLQRSERAVEFVDIGFFSDVYCVDL